MNRLGSQTIYSLVSSVAIPNECLVLSKVALHQIPRKWQAACRIISNGFLSWCLKDVVFGCFSLHAVTEKVPSRGSQERQRRKRTLSCFAYSLSDLTALFKITHYYYFTAENAFSTYLTVEKNLIRCVYFPPRFDLCHCFLHDFLRPDWLFATARMRLVHVSAFQEMAEAPYRVSRFNLFA